jgi:non-ribosomal peptide synthetase component F
VSAAGIEVDVLPTSFAQARLWFLDRLNPGNTAYVSHVSLRLRGPLDVDSLDPAIGAVVDRHESLRTRFVAVDGEPVQIVEPLGRARLERVDLSHEADPLAAARTLASSVARTSFDLERGPLLRCVAARLGDDDWALILALHHIVVDGWSLGVLLSDLVRAYRACSDRRAPSLPPLALQYGDYAVWQRERFDGTRLDAEIAWWRERLRDAPSVALPTDRPRPALPSHRGGRERVMIDAAVTAALRELAQAEGASFFMCLLAAYALLLARSCDQRDLVIGTPVAGRSRPELEPLVGFFVNTLALRVKLDGAPTFRQLLRRVRQVALDAYDHQELPFERLVAALSPERHLDRNPLFQTTFALQPAGTSRLQLPGIRIEPLGATSDTVKFDLALTFVEAGDQLVASLAYASDLFDAGTAAGLVRRLATLAAGIAADPDAPIETLPLLSPAERAALADGGRRVVERPGLCVHDLVARQAAATPTAPAVESEGGSLSYAELLARAEDLAGHLAFLGAAAGTVVAILLEPSRELVVAELGVLCAGAAFLPLDASTPPGRLAAVLERAAPVTVLTTAGLASRLPAGTRLVRLDAPLPDGRAEAGSATPFDLAYLVATSGTTGVPKLAAVEHRSLVNHLLWISEEVLPDHDVSLPCLSSPAFDASLKQLLGPLVRGGAVWFAPVEARGDPGAALRALAGRRRTALNCVPPLWEAMLDLVESGVAPRPTPL